MTQLVPARAKELVVAADGEHRRVFANARQLLRRIDQRDADATALILWVHGERADLDETGRVLVEMHASDDTTVRFHHEEVDHPLGNELRRAREQRAVGDVESDQARDVGGVARLGSAN